MAITERTATVVDNASAQSITGTIPLGTSAGDFILALFGMTSTVATFTPPSGWTALFTPVDYGASELLAAYYKIAVGGDTNPTGSTTAVASRQTCICQSYIGVDNTTPLDVTPVTTSPAASLTPTLNGITTVTASAMILSGITGDWSTGSWTKPAALTLRANHNSGVGRATALADAIQASAGATGTEQWTMPSSVSSCGFVAALRPAAGGLPDPSAIPVHSGTSRFGPF